MFVTCVAAAGNESPVGGLHNAILRPGPVRGQSSRARWLARAVGDLRSQDAARTERGSERWHEQLAAGMRKRAGHTMVPLQVGPIGVTCQLRRDTGPQKSVMAPEPQRCTVNLISGRARRLAPGDSTATSMLASMSFVDERARTLVGGPGSA